MSVRTAAKAQFRHEVSAWAQRLRVQPKGIYIQRMTAKWASCSATGRVCFSLDLLTQPRPFQEVVIVHELLHMRVPNHGKLFQALLSAHVPGWRKRLQAKGRAMDFIPGAERRQDGGGG